MSERIPDDLAGRLKAWEAHWASQIKRTILRGMNGDWAYVVVTQEFAFNRELSESLCELDIAVAQDPPRGVEYFDAIAIPPTTEEREEEFAKSYLNSEA